MRMAHVINMVKFMSEQLVRGGLYGDYERIHLYCERMVHKFFQADTACVTFSQGTDATFRLEDRDGNSHPDIADNSGEFTAFVRIEANILPAEEITEATVVFDGAIPNPDLTSLRIISKFRYKMVRSLTCPVEKEPRR